LQIFGIKYGLRGFYDRATKPVHLTPETVDGIQLRGGTILVWRPCFIVVCGLCFLCKLETTQQRGCLLLYSIVLRTHG
jgi:hypothetical protein